MDYQASLPDVNPSETNPPAMPWWAILTHRKPDVTRLAALPDGGAGSLKGDIAPTAIIDERYGPVILGDNTRVCHGAVLEGPLVTGKNCLIGNNAFIRGGTVLGKGVRIGFSTEVKGAVIGDHTTIGPLCFIADSLIACRVYLGAMVRTSNHRLDGKNVSAFHNGVLTDTGREKLGCFIGEGASLGVQVVILPGREIAAGTQLGPGIIVERNMPAGQYRLHQELRGTSLNGEHR
ncbi:acetyltransferase [Enterobacter bugandensis]|nr:acetyltransferase [Enterobacter bugandensis]MBF2750911.1 acetyltransferase [Enterobacter bugandensis]MBF2803464.1 acetyltransferase [Enterobacter bugandensis]MCP1116399.1 acetyltransferase [Enterobacter bugandensis]HBU6133646.1 acetyltransferase [Enterobacter cloacae]